MPKRKKKQNKTKGLFMRLIVIFCIAYAVRIIERGMSICEEQAISPASIVTAAIAFFGAELGLCVLKRIFNKEDSAEQENTKQKKEDTSSKIPTEGTQIPLG